MVQIHSEHYCRHVDFFPVRLETKVWIQAWRSLINGLLKLPCFGMRMEGCREAGRKRGIVATVPPTANGQPFLESGILRDMYPGDNETLSIWKSGRKDLTFIEGL